MIFCPPEGWNVPVCQNFIKNKTYKQKTFLIRVFNWDKVEASYFDQINMTENRLECDRKIITPMNMNV